MPPKRKRFKTSIEKHTKEETPEEHSPIRRRYILTRRPHLGGSYEQTVSASNVEGFDEDGILDESAPKTAVYRLKKLHQSETKSIFYSDKARREYHFETEILKRPEIQAWFDDSNIKQVLKDHAYLLYHALIGYIRGRRPEYLMTVILDVIYYTHDEWFEPDRDHGFKSHPRHLITILEGTKIQCIKILSSRSITGSQSPT